MNGNIENEIRNFLELTMKIKSIETEFEIQVDSLSTIISDLMSKVDDELTIKIFRILQNFDENYDELDFMNEFSNIYLIDEEDKTFTNRTRDFSFANPAGAIISKSFFIYENPNNLEEEDKQLVEKAIIKLVANIGSKRDSNLCNKLINGQFLTILVGPQNFDPENLYAYLYLVFLSKGYKSRFSEHLLYRYTIPHEIEHFIHFSQEEIPKCELIQFFEIFDVLDEYQHAQDILTRFLKMYQIIEYLLIRIVLVEFQKKAKTHKQIFKALQKTNQVDDFDKKLFKKLFDDKLDDIVVWFKNLISSKEKIKTEVEKYINNELDTSNRGNDYWVKHFVNLLYKIRNSIVHNKESEYHITIHNISTESIELINEILKKLEVIILKKLFSCYEPITYSNRNLQLY